MVEARGSDITLSYGDGRSAGAYLAEAQDRAAPGIIVIQEWWGLQHQIKGVCDRYAAAGYTAIAPDLYAGKVIPYHDEHSAETAMNALDYLESTDTIVEAAALRLKQQTAKVGLTGFCLGGIVTIVGAVRLPDIDAASAYYGAPGPDLVDASAIRVPVQAHFANGDDWCTPADADRIERLFGEATPETRVFRYDAGHGFASEDNEFYVPELTALAWRRDLEFWNRHLGGPLA